MRQWLWLVFVVACGDQQAAAPKQQAVANDPWAPSSTAAKRPVVSREEVEAMIGLNGDILVYKNEGSSLQVDARRVAEQTPGVAFASPTMFKWLVISHGDEFRDIRIQGAERVTDLASLRQHMVTGSLTDFARQVEPPAIVLGSSLARRIGAQVGDDVRLSIDYNGEGKPFRVVGTFKYDVSEWDQRTAIVALPRLQEFGAKGATSFVGVWVTRPSESARVAQALRQTLKTAYSVIDTHQAARSAGAP